MELVKDEACKKCQRSTFVLCYYHCICCYRCQDETEEEREPLPEAWKRKEREESEKGPKSYEDFLYIEIPVESQVFSEIL